MFKFSYDCILDEATATDEREYFEETRDSMDEVNILLDMCKAGELGIIDWNSLVIEDTSLGKTYEIDFSLKEK